jgi:16S rRNA (guanine966-N2)-methyltransferase
MGMVREALFSMLEARGVNWPETRVLDLFAGSGGLGFEALSRGAAEALFVETAPYAVKVIAANAKLLGIEDFRLRIRQEDVARVLPRPPVAPFSLVCIDPPYGMKAVERTLPPLLKNGWVLPGALVNAELEARARFDPEKAHPALAVLADRGYGQTRVILWTVNQA